jgi:hypothetical protein
MIILFLNSFQGNPPSILFQKATEEQAVSRAKSKLFECSSESMQKPYTLRVICFVAQLGYGLYSLPVIFSATSDYQS